MRSLSCGVRERWLCLSHLFSSLVQSLIVGAILKEFRAKGWSFIPTPSSLSSVVRLESSLS